MKKTFIVFFFSLKWRVIHKGTFETILAPDFIGAFTEDKKTFETALILDYAVGVRV